MVALALPVPLRLGTTVRFSSPRIVRAFLLEELKELKKMKVAKDQKRKGKKTGKK